MSLKVVQPNESRFSMFVFAASSLKMYDWELRPNESCATSTSTKSALVKKCLRVTAAAETVSAHFQQEIFPSCQQGFRQQAMSVLPIATTLFYMK